MKAAQPRSGSKLLSVKDATVTYGFTRGYLYEQVSAGRIPHVRLPNSSRVFLRREDLDALIERSTVRR